MMTRLCDIRFTTVSVKLDLQKVTINGRNGDFNTKSLAEVVNTPVVNELVVKTWIDRACMYSSPSIVSVSISVTLTTLQANRKSTLVFCVNVDHVKSLTQTFRKYGVDARYIYSETPHVQRRLLLDEFRSGQFPVLVNCGEYLINSRQKIQIIEHDTAILTEGADIPNIDCVLVARPTRSRNVFAQMVCFLVFFFDN